MSTVVRMTKYFQDYLKRTFAKLRDEKSLIYENQTYFEWLKMHREADQLQSLYSAYQQSTRRLPAKANINRATHQGTCQCCLRIQALPQGRLAKHGYQVAFRGSGGWFSGTCRGSGECK